MKATYDEKQRYLSISSSADPASSESLSAWNLHKTENKENLKIMWYQLWVADAH